LTSVQNRPCIGNEKHCLWCGKAFTPLNPKGKFCKTSHRVALYKFKKRRLQRIARKDALEQLRWKPAIPWSEQAIRDLIRQADDIEERYLR